MQIREIYLHFGPPEGQELPHTYVYNKECVKFHFLPLDVASDIRNFLHKSPTQLKETQVGACCQLLLPAQWRGKVENQLRKAFAQ